MSLGPRPTQDGTLPSGPDARRPPRGRVRMLAPAAVTDVSCTRTIEGLWWLLVPFPPWRPRIAVRWVRPCGLHAGFRGIGDGVRRPAISNRDIAISGSVLRLGRRRARGRRPDMRAGRSPRPLPRSAAGHRLPSARSAASSWARAGTTFPAAAARVAYVKINRDARRAVAAQGLLPVTARTSGSHQNRHRQLSITRRDLDRRTRPAGRAGRRTRRPPKAGHRPATGPGRAGRDAPGKTGRPGPQGHRARRARRTRRPAGRRGSGRVRRAPTGAPGPQGEPGATGAQGLQGEPEGPSGPQGDRPGRHGSDRPRTGAATVRRARSAPGRAAG